METKVLRIGSVRALLAAETISTSGAQIDRLSKKYTGRDVYGSRQPGEKRVTVRIAPTRIQSRGLDVE